MTIKDLSYVDLLISTATLLLPIWLSYRGRLNIHRDLIVGAARCFAQLTLMGYLLKYIFDLNSAPAVLALLGAMVFFAAQTVSGRLRERLTGLLGHSLLSVGITSFLTLAFVTQIVVRVEPWYSPRYLVGLAGMIIGNAMNGSALAAERLISELKLRAQAIEVLLALGATPRQATAEAVRATIRASLIPPVNSLMTVGLVHLPGIMTGQILGGAPPDTATRYQIMIMYTLTFVSAMTAIAMTTLTVSRFFTPRAQLRQDLLADGPR
ncbi:MAG TPA: iron export ABC transporter permease subunit FetB [Armatimonadetes bacterium]|mgnify:CR=1 FL=1|nr:iron export ABC transporter permease subunit FetB [Armatimonadota bacterium]